MCRNKYYGRKLDVEGFREALCQFLHNGNRLRTDAIIPLVEKLQELKAVLMNLDTYRFYTSSLLLIYEGLDPELNGDEEDDDDVVNGAATSGGTGGGECGEATFNRMDEGEVMTDSTTTTTSSGTAGTTLFRSPPPSSRSVDSICRVSSQEGANEGLHMSSSSSSDALTSTPSNNISNHHQQQHLHHHNNNSYTTSSVRSSRSTLGSRGSTPSSTSLLSESVDVRMIDFAHATHSGLGLGHCAKEHAGPDTGYIFGLSNLIKTLQEIIQEECTF